MSDEFPINNFEQEVSEISMEINIRRSAIEREHGIVEEKKVAREVIGNKIQEAGSYNQSRAQMPPTSNKTISSKKESYLDVLNEEDTNKVVALVEHMREVGIKKAIAKAREDDPYVLDTFHDVLVDKLYDELKEGGHI